MAAPYLALSEEATPRRTRFIVKAFVLSFLVGLGCTVLFSQVLSGGGQYLAVQDPINAVAFQPVSQQVRNGQALLRIKAQLGKSEAHVASAGIAALTGQSPSRRSVAAKAMVSAVRLAAQQGTYAGCRGNLACVRAVGLFFGTQTGKTEEVAGVIGEAAGLEATDIGEVSAEDLAGYDGLLVGVPTWHTGADEQRSGTTWDDYLDEIKGLDLCGKPVAVFGAGDSMGYGDNFCDAIEELHSTFEAAGAKMLGYTDASGYQHAESKSVKDGKFLGLPLDQDNEDDMTQDRVNTWIEQIKGEGMPL